MDDLFSEFTPEQLQKAMGVYAALKGYGQRMPFDKQLDVALMVVAGYDQCQEEGTSFRAWVRENMSVSVQTAYTLLKAGQAIREWSRARARETLPASKDALQTDGDGQNSAR